MFWYEPYECSHVNVFGYATADHVYLPQLAAHGAIPSPGLLPGVSVCLLSVLCACLYVCMCVCVCMCMHADVYMCVCYYYCYLSPYTVATPRLLSANQMVAGFPTYALQSPILKTGTVYDCVVVCMYMHACIVEID